MKKTLLLISVLTSLSAQGFVVDWDKIRHWSGAGPNEAAVVIQFDAEQSEEAYIWGYRYADGETPSGETMLRAVVEGSPDLVLLTQYTSESLGNTVDGFGMSEDCTAVLQNLRYDFEAAAADDRISFGYYSPNTGMGQTDAPGYDAAVLCANAIEEATETHIIEHPLNARAYGYPAYDYDHWQLDGVTDPDVRWNAGWYVGYWSYWVGGESSDDLAYSGLGITSAEVSNRCVHAFKFTSLDGGFGGPEEWGELNYNHYLEDEVPAGIDLTTAFDNATVTVRGTNLTFKGYDGACITICNLEGGSVRSYKITGNETVIDTALPAGIYVATGNNGKSHKFVIK